jgi:hypothetical protein
MRMHDLIIGRVPTDIMRLRIAECKDLVGKMDIRPLGDPDWKSFPGCADAVFYGFDLAGELAGEIFTAGTLAGEVSFDV